MNNETKAVGVPAGPYRVVQEYRRGRNLPFYIIVGRGNCALRYPTGRRLTWQSEAAANAALARIGGDA